MRKRNRCQNKACGVLFTPCPQVPGQKHCSQRECQQARKKEWNRKKIATDPDYREARKAAQQRWKEKNPHYWKEYRINHPNYTQKNRNKQKVRNHKRSKHLSVKKTAKTDESIPINSIVTGRYKIIPIHSDFVAKTDECIVEITAIQDG